MCKDCDARRKLARDALLSAKLGEVVAHVAKGAAEAVGLKKKTGTAELKKSQAKKTPAPPVNSPVGRDTVE